MCRSFILTALFSLTLCSPTQHPLLSQQPLNTKKELVSSQALQDDITGDALFEHAKHLYDLAKLAEHEYNHPTRVIGSAGKSRNWRSPPYII
jgi:aminopeptidase Y